MPRIPLYQLDAFAERVFSGNPAAVCPLEAWPDDAVLQGIANENNLSETAFFTGGDGRYRLRWFTPAVEVDLCGHATLASAWVILNRLEPGRDRVDFETASGPLAVARRGELLELDFPSRPPAPCAAPQDLIDGLGHAPVAVLTARDYFCVYTDEQDVRALRPDFARLRRLDRMVIVTAEGDEADFVSRFFAPGKGVDEDPVTGSAHCSLTPYWAERLGQSKLRARQLSARGGELHCEDRGERVAIAGRVVPYLEGWIEV